MNSSASHPKTAAIIVAAGTGERLPGEVPKAYRQLGGRSVLEYSVALFSAHPTISRVVVMFHPQHLGYLKQVLVRYPNVITAEGGKTRQESVFRGLQALRDKQIERVLVHDAARPFATRELVDALLVELDKEKAAIPSLPVRDTLKIMDKKSYVQSTPERDFIAIAQTPQAFDYSILYSLHEKFQGQQATDDAMLAEWKKIPVKLIAGDPGNIKLTYPEDLRMAQQQFSNAVFRTGMGFDVHKLVPHESHTPDKRRVIRLCGVDIHSSFRLEGHSDADAGLHALTDAILGALAEGDIGMHFLPSEPKWRGADSSIFLVEAKRLMQKHKAELVNADITLIAQAPRISPHREVMRERIARLMDAPLSAISIKATTTEGLGFTGREEGIAAQAVVMLKVAADE